MGGVTDIPQVGGGETAAVVLADNPQARRAAIHGVQLFVGREFFHFCQYEQPGTSNILSYTDGLGHKS